MANQVNILNNFYKSNLTIDAATYDIVYSFFAERTSDKKIANTFTENLFRVASQSGVDVMELLEAFEGTDKLKMSLTMAYYLNTYSDKTVLYGVSVEVQANQFVTRNIIR
jgi:hypothetical protein